MRSAEHLWPALWKAEARMSRTACSGNAVESTIMALRPPVSAISGASGARLSAMVAVDELGRLGRAGETDAGDTRVRRDRPADLRAAARQKLDRGFGDARLMHQRHGSGGDQRGLLGGLGDDRVARRQRAEIWPEKIASGKFHGEMQAITPRGAPWPSRRTASLA